MRWEPFAVFVLFAVAMICIGYAMGKPSNVEPAAVPVERIQQESPRLTVEWKVNSKGEPFYVVHDRITGKTTTVRSSTERENHGRP
jgi:hypothetical protein